MVILLGGIFPAGKGAWSLPGPTAELGSPLLGQWDQAQPAVGLEGGWAVPTGVRLEARVPLALRAKTSLGRAGLARQEVVNAEPY